MAYVPAVLKVVVKVAMPCELMMPVPRTVVPYMKVTTSPAVLAIVPVGEESVAVKVTALPVRDGLADVASVILTW